MVGWGSRNGHHVVQMWGSPRKLPFHLGAKRREWMGMGVAGMIIDSACGSFPHSLKKHQLNLTSCVLLRTLSLTCGSLGTSSSLSHPCSVPRFRIVLQAFRASKSVCTWNSEHVLRVLIHIYFHPLTPILIGHETSSCFWPLASNQQVQSLMTTRSRSWESHHGWGGREPGICQREKTRDVGAEVSSHTISTFWTFAADSIVYHIT